MSSPARNFIQNAISEGRVIAPKWIIHAILDNYPGISGEDADFYIRCAYERMRSTVRAAVRDETPAELGVEGFDHLQRAYLVEREGEQVIVPIDQCSDAELLTKIDEYRKMAQGCEKHALELECYRRLCRPLPTSDESRSDSGAASNPKSTFGGSN